MPVSDFEGGVNVNVITQIVLPRLNNSKGPPAGEKNKTLQLPTSSVILRAFPGTNRNSFPVFNDYAEAA